MGRNYQSNYRDQTPKEFEETVVQINRISKKTKGGNQVRFSALVVVGNKKGKVGVGLSKATDVRSAIRKAIDKATRSVVEIRMAGSTLPYSVREKFSAAKVLLKPAPSGSGIIAGGPMRVVLELAGVPDIVGKMLGANNKVNNARATIKALKSLKPRAMNKK